MVDQLFDYLWSFECLIIRSSLLAQTKWQFKCIIHKPLKTVVSYNMGPTKTIVEQTFMRKVQVCLKFCHHALKWWHIHNSCVRMLMYVYVQLQHRRDTLISNYNAIFALLSACAYILTGREPVFNSKVRLIARCAWLYPSMHEHVWYLMLNKGVWPNARSCNRSHYCKSPSSKRCLLLEKHENRTQT